MSVVEFCNYLTLNGYPADTVKRFNIDCNIVTIMGERMPTTLEEWFVCFDAWKVARIHVVSIH